jgi:hypothetical protein
MPQEPVALVQQTEVVAEVGHSEVTRLVVNQAQAVAV